MPTSVSSRFRGPPAGRPSGRHSTALTSVAVRVGVIVPISLGAGRGRVLVLARHAPLREARRGQRPRLGVGLRPLHLGPARRTAGGDPRRVERDRRLAASTSRVELGQLVTCISFRNPGLLAKMAVTVDEISGGRLTLGLGAGWYDAEYEAFGYPTDQRFSRFQEAYEIVRRSLPANASRSLAVTTPCRSTAAARPQPPHPASRCRGAPARAAPDRPLGRRLEHCLVRRTRRAAPRAAQPRRCARCGRTRSPDDPSDRRHRSPRLGRCARRSGRCVVRTVDRRARVGAWSARGAWHRRRHRRSRADDRAVA